MNSFLNQLTFIVLVLVIAGVVFSILFGTPKKNSKKAINFSGSKKNKTESKKTKFNRLKDIGIDDYFGTIEVKPTSGLSISRIVLGRKADTIEIPSMDEEQFFSIGRDTENDFVLRDNSVSREHAYIIKEKGDYYLVDNNSTNGIRAKKDDTKITKLRLVDQNIGLKLGNIKIEIDNKKSSNTKTYNF